MNAIDRDECLNDIANLADALKWVDRSLSVYAKETLGEELLKTIQQDIEKLRQTIAVADSKVRFL